MEITKKKGINGSELKYIAILAMLIDHIAWLFVPIDTPLAQIMHLLGRITAPVMCFFLSEGFHYTRNFGRYLKRLCIFAVISHFAYSYYWEMDFFAESRESMITTLTLCLITLWVVNNDRLNRGYKLAIVLLIMYFAEFCSWGATAVFFTLAFEFARGNRKSQLIAYSIVAFVCNILPLIKPAVNNQDLFMQQIYNFGLFLPVPLLHMYNGEKGGSKSTKWIFYIFYPAHLIFLGYINYRY